MGKSNNLARIGLFALLTGLFALAIHIGRLPAIHAERPVGGAYDVIVVGSGPEAVSAAVAAAEEGERTLIIDEHHAPGGLITDGWLNTLDMNYLPDGRLATRGFFARFLRNMAADSVDLRRAEDFFQSALDKAGISIGFGYTDIEPLLSEDTERAVRTVDGLSATGPDGRRVHVTAGRVIDATPDADFAAKSGARFTVGRESLGRDRLSMAPTLVFRIGGVDWPAVSRALHDDGDASTGANSSSAWGFRAQTRAYHPRDENLYLRGLNLGRQSDGSVLINALLIFGVDPLSATSRLEGRRRAEAELPRLVAYLRDKIPGFSAVRLLGAAPELYIRESRHITSLYQLTINDVLDNRTFTDTIAVGSYPVDLQPYAPGDHGSVVGVPKAYGIPFRSLIPEGFGNLLVVGRAAGFDPLAAGSARVLPVGMSTGEAAGAAAALSLQAGRDFPSLAADPAMVHDLRLQLEKRGAYVGPNALAVSGHLAPPPVTDQWLKPGLDLARRLGIAQGGYRNDYALDKKVSPAQLADWLRLVAPSAVLPSSIATRPVTRSEAYVLLYRASGTDL